MFLAGKYGNLEYAVRCVFLFTIVFLLRSSQRSV